MLELTIGKIAEITGGRCIDADLDAVVHGPVEFDSRKVTPGSIFMALPGAHVDGHDYADKARELGASLLLVGRDVQEGPAIVAHPVDVAQESSNATAFEHDVDGQGAAVLAAVDRLARYNTDALAEQGLVVVGVTGSAGKTSTKDLIGSVLRADGDTVAPPGSFNNEIGLPYTALRAGTSTKYLVSEMSARGQGHIRHLTEVTPPLIGLVLNVGSAHLGEFGSREIIAKAKGELVEAVPGHGVAVLNADDDQVAAMDSRTQARVVYFSAQGPVGAARGDRADYYATDVELDELARARFTLHHPHGEPVAIELQVFGEHQVSNAVAAAAVGMEAGIAPQTVATALNGHRATSAHRMDVRRRRDGVTVINDSYNANPESMRAGLQALAYTARDGRSWAVLGQMGELGDNAYDEHAELGAYVGKLAISTAVIVGNGVNQQAMAAAAQEAGVRVQQVEDIDAAVNFVDLQLQAGDVVLVKASQSEGLWAVAEGLLFGESEGA